MVISHVRMMQNDAAGDLARSEFVRGTEIAGSGEVGGEVRSWAQLWN